MKAIILVLFVHENQNEDVTNQLIFFDNKQQLYNYINSNKKCYIFECPVMDMGRVRIFSLSILEKGMNFREPLLQFLDLIL